MIRRVYYWFKATPADRPGGPWWYRDFNVHDVWTLKKKDEFIEALKPVCLNLVIVSRDVVRDGPELPEHATAADIEPPTHRYSIDWRIKDGRRWKPPMDARCLQCEEDVEIHPDDATDELGYYDLSLGGNERFYLNDLCAFCQDVQEPPLEMPAEHCLNPRAREWEK